MANKGKSINQLFAQAQKESNNSKLIELYAQASKTSINIQISTATASKISFTSFKNTMSESQNNAHPS